MAPLVNITCEDLRDKAGTHFNLKPRPLYYNLSHHSSTYGQPVTPTVQCGEGVTTLLNFHKRAGVWLWPFASQRSLGKATHVTPHVMRISSLNQYTCSRLADRSWKGHSFVPNWQLNLVAGYLKKKKGTNYTWKDVGEGERKMQWANVPSWHLPFDSKKEMAIIQNFSIIVASAASWIRL